MTWTLSLLRIFLNGKFLIGSLIQEVQRIGWIIVYFIFYAFFATQWWMWLLFPITCLTGPVHGAIINYFAHKYGYRNFKTPDTSKNFLPVDILMLGEKDHNNHHKLMARPNFGVRWFENRSSVSGNKVPKLG